MLDRKKEEEEEEIFKTEEREAEETKRKEEEARNELRRKLAEKEHEITMKAKIFGTKGKKPIVGDFPNKKMQHSTSAPPNANNANSRSPVPSKVVVVKPEVPTSITRPTSAMTTVKSSLKRTTTVPGLPSASRVTVSSPPLPKSSSTEKLPNLVKTPTKKTTVVT